MAGRSVDDAGRISRCCRRRLARTLVGVAVVAASVFLQPAPASAETFKPFTLKTLDGQARSLSDFPGKATLVVFFFPTCPFCSAAAPHVQRLYGEYRDRGLGLVWINVMADEERLVPEWQARHGVTAPVLVGGSQDKLQRAYGLRMTPTHVLVDSGGTVLFKHAGHRPGDEEKLEAAIRKALAVAD